MQAHPTVTVRLDRAQREAIRHEISVLGAAGGDIDLFLDFGRPDRPDQVADRDYLAQLLEALAGSVRVLDVIGWEEPGDADEIEVRIDDAMSEWAAERATALRRSFRDFHPTDQNVAALTAFDSMVGVR